MLNATIGLGTAPLKIMKPNITQNTVSENAILFCFSLTLLSDQQPKYDRHLDVFLVYATNFPDFRISGADPGKLSSVT